MKYVTRLKDGKPFQFQECPRCGLAVGDDCECKPDNDGGRWLIPWLIFSAIIGLGAVFYASTAEAQWYDERKLEYTPTKTHSIYGKGTYVEPASFYDQGDVVECILINVGSRKTVDVNTFILPYRRLVVFPYHQDTVGWCKQGDIANVMEN